MQVLLSLCCLLPLAVYSQTTQGPLPTHSWVSCQYKQNGFLEMGCWGYVTCKDGVPFTTYCPTGQVYDRDSSTCVPPGTNHVKCNQVKPCALKYDHRYADIEDKCESYYLCMAQSFFGRFYCPKGTVFNEPLQTCDYPGDTPPPCGTLTYTRTTPHF
ncbi:peritrophin-48-like [Haliotis cracherodii]|uniref:peritrophin-48-like n=1 Tax=Haliotis cracherodii TaxID=6455 RepID=UPI0039EC7A12